MNNNELIIWTIILIISVLSINPITKRCSRSNAKVIWFLLGGLIMALLFFSGLAVGLETLHRLFPKQ